LPRPLQESHATPSGSLRRITLIDGRGGETEACCFALGIRNNGDAPAELLLLGKDKEAVLKTAVKASLDKQEDSLELSAERQSKGGLLTLKIAGIYEASFMVTDSERYLPLFFSRIHVPCGVKTIDGPREDAVFQSGG
jgi:hypothetical protein